MFCVISYHSDKYSFSLFICLCFNWLFFVVDLPLIFTHCTCLAFTLSQLVLQGVALLVMSFIFHKFERKCNEVTGPWVYIPEIYMHGSVLLRHEVESVDDRITTSRGNVMASFLRIGRSKHIFGPFSLWGMVAYILLVVFSFCERRRNTYKIFRQMSRSGSLQHFL